MKPSKNGNGPLAFHEPYFDQVTHHVDSTSVCPDSATSKKRQPQKTGAAKPGRIHHPESYLTDALKGTQSILLRERKEEQKG